MQNIKKISQYTALFAFVFLAISFQAYAKPKAELLHEEEGTIALENGQTLFYLAKGEQGEKPLLLFIHGAPENAYVWEDYMRYFSRDYFTVAYNSRGVYPSSLPESDDLSEYDTTMLAADALLVAQSFGYDNFIIVGHDWGAATAWRAAINYPDNVDKLVAISNPHPIMYMRAYNESEHHKALVDAYIPLIREDIAPWTVEGTLADDVALYKEYVYSDEVQKTMTWALGEKLEQMWLADDGASIEAVYKQYKALDFPFAHITSCEPFPGYSFTVEQPVLSIFGTLDNFISHEAYKLADNDCHPNSELLELPNAGHFLHHDYKSYLMKKIRRYLKSV